MNCRLCEKRKPRRQCPGVHGDICAPCCGEQREVTISCPLDCEYLLESRGHEKFEDLDPSQMPNVDIRITEEFLTQHAHLVNLISEIVLAAALNAEGSNDNDVREALDAMIKTYRTRQSGLVYETRPANPIAGAIQQSASARIEELERAFAEQRGGTGKLRDADILGVLVIIQRLALRFNNKRPRGRTFILYQISRHLQQAAERTAQAPSLLVG